MQILRQTQTIATRILPALELLVIIAPIICLVDCVLIPVALFLLPLMGIHNLIHGISDQIATLVVIAICLPSFIPGFLRHRRKRVLLLMAFGVSLIFFANFAGHLADQSFHWVIMIFGSFCLIKANLENRKGSMCGCHASGAESKQLSQ